MMGKNPYETSDVDSLSPLEIEESPQARQWAMFTHLAGLSMYVGLPFGNILGPLIVWMIKKDEYPFVDDQGKEAMNFHITMTIWLLVAAASTCILVGFVLLPIVGVVEIVFTVIAAINANAGTPYRYPMTFRLIT